MIFFKVENATFSPNDKYFIKNITFRIAKKGQIVSLLGPSELEKHLY